MMGYVAKDPNMVPGLMNTNNFTRNLPLEGVDFDAGGTFGARTGGEL